MMRWNSFSGSLVFAAAGAAGLALAATALVPPFHLRTLLTGYAVAAAVVYVVGIAPSRTRGLAAGALASALGVGLLLLPLRLPGTLIGAALVVSLCRSGLLYRSRPLRAVVLEGALCAGGLALASLLANGGVASLALGFWSYFLVQSVFFVVGGVGPREAESPVDPFDRARAQLLALLD
jgi:hypothetical protein